MSTDYERFVQQVYQSLVSQDAIRNVEVKHNVVLTGKSGATHQIDVFWEFEIAGQRYRTCVECKHYSKAVEKTHVASFATVLADIGNANGVLVTTESYQKGAKLLAQHANIRLIVLNPLLREIQVDMVLQIPDQTNFQFEFEPTGTKAVLLAAGLQTFHYSVRGQDAVLKHNESGALLDVAEAIGPLPEAGSIRVDLSAFSLQTEVGFFPLLAVTFDLQYSEMHEQMSIKAEHAVNAILEDVLANTKSYVHDDGTTKPVPPDNAF
jgi:hypothetical protein